MDATVLSGAVSYTVPGGRSQVLRGTRRIPMGSAFSVRHGSVRLTVSGGPGPTSSGEFSRGAFRLLPSAAGSGGVAIRLVGNSCIRAARLGAVAARARHKAPTVRSAPPPERRVTAPGSPARTYRRLQVRAGGGFLIVGTDADALAQGQARYGVVDECDGTRIRDQRGRVIVRRRLGPSQSLRPGFSELDYCHPPGMDPGFCLSVTASLRSNVFSFAAALRHARGRAYDLCYGTNARNRGCVGGVLSSGPVASTRARCGLDGGGGLYTIRFLLRGRQLGFALRLRASAANPTGPSTAACRGR